MTRTARVSQLTPEPGDALLKQGQGHGASFRISHPWPGGIMQELHEGGTDLFRTPAPFLMLLGVPLSISELEGLVQRHGLIQSSLRPAAVRRLPSLGTGTLGQGVGHGWGKGGGLGHWTGASRLSHPGCMSRHSRENRVHHPLRTGQRHRPLRWTHLFASLFSLAERARHPDLGGLSVANRRLQQRLSLAQRLMEAMPPSLTPGRTIGDRFWEVIRWGGLGLVMARLLS